eukprot:TRINITY_DN3517_c0_g1_i1.p1 TRINITY_DN3517_c0_g1~~TRINITY_DN3517_c0_g1_i1.p1  ORF type:complete len:281 (+),score=91.57 TRINITY_DN3517_c0_g1_i1:142-984(+)
MGTLTKKILKAREYKERAQPAARTHLGILEKRKDYKARAQEKKQKEQFLQGLRKAAANKNKDEFKFNMITQTNRRENIEKPDSFWDEGGEEQVEKPKLTKEELALATTQGLGYLMAKITAERNKIERLEAMRLVPEKPKNKHIVFVETTKEVKKFKPEEYFQTPAEALSSVHNRPRKETLESTELVVNRRVADVNEIAKERRKVDNELEARKKRLALLEEAREALEYRQKVVKGGEVVQEAKQDTQKVDDEDYKWAWELPDEVQSHKRFPDVKFKQIRKK